MSLRIKILKIKESSNHCDFIGVNFIGYCVAGVYSGESFVNAIIYCVAKDNLLKRFKYYKLCDKEKHKSEICLTDQFETYDMLEQIYTDYPTLNKNIGLLEIKKNTICDVVLEALDKLLFDYITNLEPLSTPYTPPNGTNAKCNYDNNSNSNNDVYSDFVLTHVNNFGHGDFSI